jgi:hypothetical protein
MLIAASFIDMSSPSTKWLLLLFALAVIYLTMIRPGLKKKKDPLARTPGITNLARQKNVERQMQTLLVELSEMARQITAQLDTRAAKLQALIAEADEKIAMLNNAPGQSPRANFDSFKADAVVPAAQTVETDPAVENRNRQVYALADDGQNAAEIAATLDQPRGEIELILALRSRS